MKPKTPDDILELLDASYTSTALGVAMELGLFWMLEEKPRDENEIARTLGIPPMRCHYWLQLLSNAGLLERGPDGYAPSSTARRTILDVFDQNSWGLLAEEARHRLPSLNDLTHRIREPGPIELTPSEYITEMTEDPERARRFTRMLYELHQPLAENLADALDLDGVSRLMDLGGGSGVLSLGLVDRNPRLNAVVVDIANVCAVGREIAAGTPNADRVTYHPADFLADELPSGFDVILECDVNVYSDELFRKVWSSLNSGGRFFVVDQFAPAERIAPPVRVHWALEGALLDPNFAFQTAAQIRDLLEKADFEVVSEKMLPVVPGPCTRFTVGMSIIEARKN